MGTLGQGTIAIGVLLLLLCAPSVLAGSSEYLFPNETLGSPLSTVDVDGALHRIYPVIGSSDRLVLLTDGSLAKEENSQKTLFVYHSHLHVKKHHDSISQEYKRTYNLLYEGTESFEQQILRAFQLLQEQCAPVPYIQVISICVKPTDRLRIMEMGTKGAKLLDWDNALSQYRQLGGSILYLDDNNEKFIYNAVEENYMDMLTDYYFLKEAGRITGRSYTTNNILNPEAILSQASLSASTDYKTITDRIGRLQQAQTNRKNTAETKLESIRTTNKEVAKAWGEYSTIEEQRQQLKKELTNVNLETPTYRTNIETLDKITLEIAKLQVSADETLNKYEAEYDARNPLSKIWFGFWGWALSLFV